MKTSSFVIFISIVLLIYTSLNYYIFIRGLQALPNRSWAKLIYIIIFGLLFFAYIAARIFEKYDNTGITLALNYIGSVWLGAMLYFFIIVVSVDLIRLLNHFIHFIPAIVTEHWDKAKLFAMLGSIFVVLIVLVSGYINARNPVTKEFDITINKKSEVIKSLKIVMASDLHIGHIINKAHVQKLVKRINEINPDVVLFPGDILDEDITPVAQNGMGEPFRQLHPRFGVWAITGNHEYIGGAERAVKYIESLGIKMLRDTSVLIENSFYLIGREDRDKSRFSAAQRKSLEEIMTNLDKSKPIILLDHQPFQLELAERNRIDLQLSGHTHHGQLWPLNLITNAVYEKSWGYLKKGETQIYVSCGYGTWGPPLRTGNRPEIIIFNISFR